MSVAECEWGYFKLLMPLLIELGDGGIGVGWFPVESGLLLGGKRVLQI